MTDQAATSDRLYWPTLKNITQGGRRLLICETTVAPACRSRATHGPHR